MPDLSFDATITIGHHHMAAVGLDPLHSTIVAVDAVRRAVGSMTGANWIDVTAADYPSTCPGWVTVYPPGSSITPNTPEWRECRRKVEEYVKTALTAASVPF